MAGEVVSLSSYLLQHAHKKYLCQFILDAQHVHTIYIRAHAHTRTHTSELISVQNEAAFEGCGEPVVDEPLNSIGQAWKSFFHKTVSVSSLLSNIPLFVVCFVSFSFPNIVLLCFFLTEVAYLHLEFCFFTIFCCV